MHLFVFRSERREQNDSEYQAGKDEYSSKLCLSHAHTSGTAESEILHGLHQSLLTK